MNMSRTFKQSCEDTLKIGELDQLYMTIHGIPQSSEQIEVTQSLHNYHYFGTYLAPKFCTLFLAPSFLCSLPFALI